MKGVLTCPFISYSVFLSKAIQLFRFYSWGTMTQSTLEHTTVWILLFYVFLSEPRRVSKGNWRTDPHSTRTCHVLLYYGSSLTEDLTLGVSTSLVRHEIIHHRSQYGLTFIWWPVESVSYIWVLFTTKPLFLVRSRFLCLGYIQRKLFRIWFSLF